jgi:hypothetical protein
MAGRARGTLSSCRWRGASCFFWEEFGCSGDSFSALFADGNLNVVAMVGYWSGRIPYGFYGRGSFSGCKLAGVQGGEREDRPLCYGRAAENKKRPVEKQVAALFCDADRTQTCNLLIRRRNFGVFAVFW